MKEQRRCENCANLPVCEKSKFVVWCGCWRSQADFVRKCARQDILTGKDRDGLEKIAKEMEGEEK